MTISMKHMCVARRVSSAPWVVGDDGANDSRRKLTDRLEFVNVFGLFPAAVLR